MKYGTDEDDITGHAGGQPAPPLAALIRRGAVGDLGETGVSRWVRRRVPDRT